jgi:diguanylate cyclase (GGDEF)-like protein/PAS domain S-box-containing protein
VDAEEALLALLDGDPTALVGALGSDADWAPVPGSVSLPTHQEFTGGSGLDLVVADDQVAVIEAWSRAQREPIVRLDVHLLGDADHVVHLSIFDLRAEHGVHVLVLQGHNAEAVARSAAVRPVRRYTTATTKKDAAAVFLEVDEATTAMLGWEADELIGRSTKELVHPDDVRTAIDEWLALRAGHGQRRVRIRVRHKAGHYLWVEVTNHNHLEDPELGCVISEMVDISDEMARLEAMREREQLLARLAEALPIGICHLRPDRAVVYANLPLLALLGPVDSVDALLRNLGDADRALVEAGIDNALRGRAGNVEVSMSQQRRCEFSFRPMTTDSGSVDGVIVCASDVTDRCRLRAELEHRASHDALTGCLNRAATVVALERALRESAHVAVAYIDLDHFKAINDELGHAAGDEVLRAAASRLRAATRGSDQLARLGGDEFVMVCSSNLAPFDPSALAHRLTAAINGDVVFAHQRIPLSASVGAAVALPGELDAEAILHRADTAMYARKHRARGLVPATPR